MPDSPAEWRIVDEPWPFGPPCAHEWEPCHKHHGEHDECVQCGALRYPIRGQIAVSSDPTRTNA